MATKTKDAKSDKSNRRERFETSSGIELPVDFNPSNTEALEYDRDLGDPGDFPYTRGIRRNMYRGRLWTMRQYAGYATAELPPGRFEPVGLSFVGGSLAVPGKELGAAYDEAMRAKVFAPLGMNSTTFDFARALRKHVAGVGIGAERRGHQQQDQHRRRHAEQSPCPAG